MHPSTLGRELSRNTELRGYRPQQAQRLADFHHDLQGFMVRNLKLQHTF